MAVLPGVLGCRPLRRTVEVRLGTNPAVPRDELPGGMPIFFALATLRSVPQAGSQFHSLAIPIHALSGLKFKISIGNLLQLTAIQQSYLISIHCHHTLLLKLLKRSG